MVVQYSFWVECRFMKKYTRKQKWKSSLQSWSQSIPVKLLHHAASCVFRTYTADLLPCRRPRQNPHCDNSYVLLGACSPIFSNFKIIAVLKNKEVFFLSNWLLTDSEISDICSVFPPVFRRDKKCLITNGSILWSSQFFLSWLLFLPLVKIEYCAKRK